MIQYKRYSDDIVIPTRYKNCSLDLVEEKVRLEIILLVRNGKSLYVWGPCGTGKTYLAYSIMKTFGEKNKGQVALYYPVSEMLSDIREDLFDRRNDNDSSLYPSLLENIANFKGYLILDDLGSEKITDFVSETLYKIVNTRYGEESRTIFISNLSFKELADTYGDRLVSRIVGLCTAVEVKGKDKRLENHV